MNRKRLDFEALRDALLAASGQLDRSLGGPAVELTKAPWPQRRTLYGLIDRQNLPNLFRTFDFASPDTHSPQRFTTTVPQQALFLMNSPFLRDQVRSLASRQATRRRESSRATRIERLYRLALGPAAERTGTASWAWRFWPTRMRATSAAVPAVRSSPPEAEPTLDRLGALRAGRALVERVRVCRLNRMSRTIAAGDGNPPCTPIRRLEPCYSRRELLRRSGMGFGSLALAPLLGRRAAAIGCGGRSRSIRSRPRCPTFRPRPSASSTCS